MISTHARAHAPLRGELTAKHGHFLQPNSSNFFSPLLLPSPPLLQDNTDIMAASTQRALEDIELRRVQLQQTVDQLRKSLSHWTTWEAEYEALKEEIQAAGDPSPSQIREIARDLELELLNKKEVEELLCKNSPTERTANQVIDMISRRIDYVRTSSATIEKNLDTAEKKLAGVDVLLEPGMDNEEGEPMMDIEEELDEEGNEISSSVNQTGKAAAELVEVLRKAGIQKAELEKKSAAQAKDQPPEAPSTSSPASDASKESAATPSSTPASASPEGHAVIDQSPAKKAVSFAEKVDVEPRKEPALKPKGTSDLASVQFPQGVRAVELEDDDDVLSSPVIPDDESPEDAELRRQMLQYGMSEVGQVVAELNLDKPTASFSDDESDEDYDDYDYNTDEDEEEDEYGRSTRPIITEEYRKEMMELEKKLGARMLENIGPQPDRSTLDEHVGDIRTMRVRKDEQFDQSLDASKSTTQPTEDGGNEQPKKKGVRFADDVDISEAPKPVPEPKRTAVTAAKPAPTIADTIVERSAPAPLSQVEPPKPAKTSRFKSARAAANTQQVLPTPPVPEAPPVPTGPAGRTLATTITEHEPLPSEPQAPDEFDPVLLNREIQAEYHKARNRFIQRQGGFKATEEDEEDPIMEERDGKPKKVSRFMAARLKAEGM
jgi:unconventional prefoldin RPB5 interactor 1